MLDKDNFGAVLHPVSFVKAKRAQSTTDNETWVEGVVAPTQNAFDVGDTRATTVVIPIQDSRVIEKNQNGLGVGKDVDPCPTVLQPYNIVFNDSNGKRKDRLNGGLYINKTEVSTSLTQAESDTKILTNVHAVSVAIQGTVIGRQDHNGPQGSGCSDSGEMFTLNSTDVHAVAFQQNTRDEVRLINGDGQIAGALAAESGMKQQNYLASTTMQVRRLTPTECERLQGFPDGWTAIPWKKKNAEDCPDGPRYKALGNSMAVNCMEWIGERINAIETQS